MIEILKDNSFVKDQNDSNAEAFCVLDGENKLGCCICKFEPENVEIVNIEFVSKIYEKMFADGLIRTVLNAADLRGLLVAICRDNKFFDVLIKTGFEIDAEKNILSINIAEFFKQECKN